MKMFVNGTSRELAATDVSAALAELGHAADATVATAVNGRFVAAHARADTPLAAGDRLEILAPMQGG